MKVIRLLKTIAGHICFICGIAILVVRILDWHNPYMDFMGHSMCLLYSLCISAIFMGVCEVHLRGTEKTGKTGRRK